MYTTQNIKTRCKKTNPLTIVVSVLPLCAIAEKWDMLVSLTFESNVSIVYKTKTKLNHQLTSSGKTTTKTYLNA